MQRLFFSKGKKDKIKPNNIIGKINDVTGTKDIRIGRIDMMENFSFVDVDQDQAQFIVDCFADERKNKEGIRVEITTSDPKPKKKKDKEKEEDGSKKRRKQFDDDRPERKNRDKYGDRSYKAEGKKESRRDSKKDSRKDSKKESRKDRNDSGRRGRNRSR